MTSLEMHSGDSLFFFLWFSRFILVCFVFFAYETLTENQWTFHVLEFLYKSKYDELFDLYFRISMNKIIVTLISKSFIGRSYINFSCIGKNILLTKLCT